MTNESEKKLLKLIKYEVFSSEITDAITEVLETISTQRKQQIQPSPFQRPKSFKRWTKEEETKLVESFLEGTTLDKIAMEHERSCNAIFQRLLLTGIVSLSETINFAKSTKSSKESVIDSIPVVKPILPGRICTNCGERIDPLRLSAQPYTYRCVTCQKDFEKLTGLSMHGNFS
jgi:DNA-directed RNA polymerase subunit RPC12/RpoP